MTTRWPDEVPILGARDIRRHFRNPGGKRHCLLGWRDEVFGFENDAVTDELRRQCGGREPEFFNDDRSIPKAEVANAWNRTMKNLGYVVGNPEG